MPHLPAPELRNLVAISELLSEVPLMRRAKLAETLLQRDYIPQLVALFAAVEDLESIEDLHRLFTIFKGIVMLNNTNVYEVLLRDDLLMGCAIITCVTAWADDNTPCTRGTGALCTCSFTRVLGPMC